MNSFATILISILISVSASILATVILNSKLYFELHKGKLVEDLIQKGDIQVRSFQLSSPTDWEEFLDFSNSYLLTMSQQGSIKKLNADNIQNIDQLKKYRCIRIRNNSSLCILIAGIYFDDGSSQNLFDWTSAEMNPNETRNLIIDSYNDVKQIVIDYNGREVHYAITDKKGYATCKIQKRKSRKLQDITLEDQASPPEETSPSGYNETENHSLEQ